MARGHWHSWRRFLVPGVGTVLGVRLQKEPERRYVPSSTPAVVSHSRIHRSGTAIGGSVEIQRYRRVSRGLYRSRFERYPSVYGERNYLAWSAARTRVNCQSVAPGLRFSAATKSWRRDLGGQPPGVPLTPSGRVPVDDGSKSTPNTTATTVTEAARHLQILARRRSLVRTWLRVLSVRGTRRSTTRLPTPPCAPYPAASRWPLKCLPGSLQVPEPS